MSFEEVAIEREGKVSMGKEQLLLDMLNVKIKAFLSDQQFEVDSVCTSDSVSSALQLMSTQGYTSVPVVELGDPRTFRGFATVIDLVRFAVSLLKAEEGAEDAKLRRPNWTGQTVFASATIKDLLAFCRSSSEMAMGLEPFQAPVSAESPLFLAFDSMLQTREHRVAVQNRAGTICGVVTQSMLMSFIAKRLYTLPDELNALAVRNWRPFNEPVLVKTSSLACDAFDLMSTRRVECVGVVDDDDRLVTCLHARDLKGVSPWNPSFKFLVKSCAAYKAHMLQQFNRSFAMENEFCCCTPDHTFAQVVRLMSNFKAHQVFVVDHTDTETKRGMHCIDVISHTDILKLINTSR